MLHAQREESRFHVMGQRIPPFPYLKFEVSVVVFLSKGVLHFYDILKFLFGGHHGLPPHQEKTQCANLAKGTTLPHG